MQRSAATQQPTSASDFITAGEALLLTANKLFGTPCQTHLIAYNMRTGAFTETAKLTDLTDTLFKGSEHVHLTIKPISEKDAKGYVTAHNNYMPALARLQIMTGKPLQAEINGVDIDMANLPLRAPVIKQPEVSATPRQPVGGRASLS